MQHVLAIVGKEGILLLVVTENIVTAVLDNPQLYALLEQTVTFNKQEGPVFPLSIVNGKCGHSSWLWKIRKETWGGSHRLA